MRVSALNRVLWYDANKQYAVFAAMSHSPPAAPQDGKQADIVDIAVLPSQESSVTEEVPERKDEPFGSTDDHVFSDPAMATHWREIYEKASYENRHRFDPEFTWTAEEEKRLVRKVRFWVTPICYSTSPFLTYC